MKTPQEYLDIIQEKHPCPANTGFERAAWLFETREALRWMLDFVELEYKHQIAEILEKNLTSDRYQLYAKYRNYTKVNVREVEQYSRELFEKLVHIKASDAEKILGRHTLYQEAANILGADIQRYQTVNATELAKTVPQHIYDRLTEKEERLMDYEIEEVTEA